MGLVLGDLAAADVVLLFGEHDDGAALGRFVGQAGKLRGVGQLVLAHAIQGKELHGLAVAERDGAGLVQQQGVDVAGRLHGLAAHGQNVVLHDAVHAGDADGRKQAADGGGDQADQQGDQHRHGGGRAGAARGHAIDGERLQGDHGEQEDQGQSRDHDVERDFVGRLLTLRAFHEGDHAIEEGLAGVGGDAHLDPIAEHLGAAGDGAAVAAGFADDGRALAGDGGFVHAGDALDDVAVTGDGLAGFHHDDVAAAQEGGGDHFDASAAQHAAGVGFGLGFAQVSACALPRPSAMASAKLANSTVNQSQSEIWKVKPATPAPAGEIAHGEDGGHDRADFHHEHDGVLHHVARVEFHQRIGEGAFDDGRVEKRPRARSLLGYDRRNVF